MPSFENSTESDVFIFPYWPQEPLKETISFLTEVLTNEDGSEERSVRRVLARRKFNYKVFLDHIKAVETVNTLENKIRGRFALPIWSEAQFVGTVAAATSEIFCNTSIYDFSSNFAILFNFCNAWEVVEIATIESASVTISNNLPEVKNAYLIPVHFARLLGGVDYSLQGGQKTISLNFELEGGYYVEPETPSQFLGKDYFLKPSNQESDFLSIEINKLEENTDNKTGLKQFNSFWDESKVIQPFENFFKNYGEMYDFKKWIFRRYGAFRSFLKPSFEESLRIKNTSLITTTLQIENTGFVASGSTRNAIYFKLKDGGFQFAQITDAVEASETIETLTLSESANLLPEDIVYVSFLGEWRLESDDIEIAHMQGGQSEVKLNFLEFSKNV